MIKPTKRATIYLDPELHKILKLKSVETSRSVSDLVNEAVRNELLEDLEDLAIIKKREKEPTISFEEMLKKLKIADEI